MKKTFSIIKLFVLFVFLSLSGSIIAVPAYRKPISIIQPDGTTITVQLHGDEFYSYRTTVDGYLTAENGMGYLTYATIDSAGNIHGSNVRAKNVEDRTADERHYLTTQTPVGDLTKFNVAKRLQKAPSGMSEAPIQKNYPLSGSPKSLVILVQFSDKSFVTQDPKTAFTNLLNEKNYRTNGGTGSAKDYFRDNSNGMFNPNFDVVGPYTLPSTMATYGGNSGGSDKAARQMVIDACALAAADSVDFAQYDTDNDGYVDNIFIYYAGFNEAEGGATNTIWPHRWALANTSTRFNGKIIYDYACTSELKGTAGSNMCGIGTFVHEFGHVLGLPDFYATNNETHHTLSAWDVMDYGPYLNAGRTPPSYSAYERFFLNWLTPTEIKSPQNLTLDTLSTSNKAYIITQNGNHNLNGGNPTPTEFFLLENRQRKGWDAYLPGHGLLITRVNYSASAWWGNTVNNTSTSMGVDIIEADDVATDASCAGDVFPGTSNVKAFMPTLRSGVSIKKPLNEITESKGIISFIFMGGEFVTEVGPLALTADKITQTSFTANWSALMYAPQYLLDVYTMVDGEKEYVAGYQNKNVGDVLSFVINNLSPGVKYYYVVRGTDGTNVTVNSNEISLTTLAYTLDMFKPVALAPSNITATSFTARWSWNTDIVTPQSYKLTVYEKSSGAETEYLTYGFNGSVFPVGWTTSNTSFYSTSGYYRESAPSAYFTLEGSSLETEVFERKIRSLQFWCRGRSTATTNSLLIYGSLDGNEWQLIKTVNPLITTEGQTIIITGAEMPESTALKFVYSKPGLGYLAIDDIKIGLQDVVNVPLADYNGINVGNVNEYQVVGLNKNSKYYYSVVASNQNTSTGNSNEIVAETLSGAYTGMGELKISYNIRSTNNELIVFTDSKSTHLQVYNLSGQKIFDKVFDESIRINKAQLPKGVYILKINNISHKFLW